MLSHTHRHVVVMHDGARSHTSQALQDCCQAQAAHLTMAQWPSYSPDVTPIAHLWKQVQKAATHLQSCPDFAQLPAEVERALLHFAHTPSELTVLMARSCETLGAKAA